MTIDLEYTPLVVDNGSGILKAGYAGDDAPRAIFDSMIGRPRQAWTGSMSVKDSYIGNDAQSHRHLLNVTYPAANGTITNWDDMEQIWKHAFDKELQVTTDDRPILLTEPPLNRKAAREKTTQIMFESFATPGFYLANTASLILAAAGQSTGVVVDCGDSLSQVVPVMDGVILSQSVRRFDVSGQDLTNYFWDLLANYSNVTKQRGSDYDVVREVKESSILYVAPDYAAELNKLNYSTELTRTAIVLGQPVELSSDRFTVPEALFQPSLIGRTISGLHTTIANAIRDCDASLHAALGSNILLAGGTCAFNGLQARLQHELGSLLPPGVAANVVYPPEGKYLAWIGGSQLAYDDAFQSKWITKAEYAEFGPSVVHRKCI
ncbi:actin family [Entophlyctis helioformis]|nr:actin family [Entophlyctis helioformis]